MEASGSAPATAPGEHTGHITQDQLDALLQDQKEAREELASLRRELDKERSSRPAPATPQDANTLFRNRVLSLRESPFYCPGCGRTYDYQRECNGRGEAPHPPIDVVSTGEVSNPPGSTDQVAWQLWRQGHTAAPES